MIASKSGARRGAGIVNGKIGLWVRPLNGDAATLLSGTENAGKPFWSPDSRSIAFVTPGAGLRRLDPGGGMPRTICSFVTAMRAGTGGDGYILFTGMMSGGQGVYRVPASGGVPVPVAVIVNWPALMRKGAAAQ